MKKRLLLVLAVLTGMFLLSASIVFAQPAPLAKTGQTTSYRIGDDGDLEKGVASPRVRFTDNGDGTVTDKLTGLMWAKNANMGGLMNWNSAIDYADNLFLGAAGCGLTWNDWRLPNVRELQSLIDFSNYSPALPSGHPFSYMQFQGYYWSSTTYTGNTNYAWIVLIQDGYVSCTDKTGYFDYNSMWPVRGGN
jgi:hypothetical protein